MLALTAWIYMCVCVFATQNPWKRTKPALTSSEAVFIESVQCLSLYSCMCLCILYLHTFFDIFAWIYPFIIIIEYMLVNKNKIYYYIIQYKNYTLQSPKTVTSAWDASEEKIHARIWCTGKCQISSIDNVCDLFGRGCVCELLPQAFIW